MIEALERRSVGEVKEIGGFDWARLRLIGSVEQPLWLRCCFTLWIGMRLAVWAGCLAVAVAAGVKARAADGLAGDR
jgi:hypothetical protein